MGSDFRKNSCHGFCGRVSSLMTSARKQDCPWTELPIVAIDIETSGAYPFADEICELAAVRTRGGVVEATFSQLVKPSKPMSDFIVGIHGISNEMVKEAPAIREVIPEFFQFIKDGYCIGHHIPFDATFLSNEFEKDNLPLPVTPLFCTSLISRNVVSGTPNHRLQTLVKHFGIKERGAHRALDDSLACFDVFKKCMELIADKVPDSSPMTAPLTASVIGPATLGDIEKIQGHQLKWTDFSFAFRSLQDPIWKKLVEAQKKSLPVEFTYRGGSRKGQARRAKIEGLVLNPTGKYIVAVDDSGQSKRFYKDKIIDLEILWTT